MFAPGEYLVKLPVALRRITAGIAAVKALHRQWFAGPAAGNVYIPLYSQGFAMPRSDHGSVMSRTIAKPAELGWGAGHVVMPKRLSLSIGRAETQHDKSGENRMAECHLSSSVKADGCSIFFASNLTSRDRLEILPARYDRNRR
jgi:hypothetical protein